MRSFLVCDGGGTKTDFLIFNEKAEILSYCQKGGANAKFLGEGIAINNIVDGIKQCIANAKISMEDLEEIMLFIPGFEECIGELKKRVDIKKIECLSDVENAFYGALGKGIGIVVLSGTGSFSVGISKENKKVITGGWGPLIGDKGSGYHIGLMCLEHLAYFYDNEIKDSKMRDLALEKFNIKNEFEMKKIIYAKDFRREKVAEFCKIVSNAAAQGDTYAVNILKEAAYDLVKLVRMVNERLGCEELKVTMIGGVAKIGDLFINIFKDKLNEECGNLTYIKAKYDPLIGAMLYVLNNDVGINIEDNYIKEKLNEYKEVYSLC